MLTENGRLVEVLQEIIAPHLLIHIMFTYFYDAFQECILGPSDALPKFWDDMIGNPMVEQGITDIPDYRARCIPMQFHGDGIVCVERGQTWQRNFDTRSFSSTVSAATKESEASNKEQQEASNKEQHGVTRSNKKMYQQRLPNEWIAALQDAFGHELFDLSGVSILSYYPDLLHVKNLGSDQYTYGENCKQITAECNLYRDNHPCEHVSPIRPDMFTGNWSMLKGRAVHGPALLHVWQLHWDPRVFTHKLIKLALKQSVEMENGEAMVDEKGCITALCQICDELNPFVRRCHRCGRRGCEFCVGGCYYCITILCFDCWMDEGCCDRGGHRNEHVPHEQSARS